VRTESAPCGFSLLYFNFLCAGLLSVNVVLVTPATPTPTASSILAQVRHADPAQSARTTGEPPSASVHRSTSAIPTFPAGKGVDSAAIIRPKTTLRTVFL
jgi:hypothetical protein